MVLKLVSFSLLLLSLPLMADQQFEVIEVRAKSNQLLANKQLVNQIDSEVIGDAATVKPTMANWFAQHPSISLNGQGGLLQSYSIRGFSRARIRTEIDGVPIITDRRAGNSASFINPLLFERADIQTGPASTLYGSEAMGGVINLVSSDFDRQQLSYSGQSDDQRQNIAALWGSGQWQSGLAYQQANNAQAADGTSLNTAFEQYSGLVKLQHNLGGYLIESSWLPSVGRDIGKSSSLYPEKRIVSYPEDKHSLFQVSIADQQDWYFKLYHHYQNWDTDTLRIDSRQNLTAYQSHTLGGLALWSVPLFSDDGRIGIDWTSRRGVNISETEFALDGTINFAKTLVDGQQDNIALYADWYWQKQALQFSAGARVDFIKQRQFVNKQSKSEQQFSGNFTVTMPLEQHTLRLELASGFRFPTLSELFFAGETPRGTTLGNSALKPEQSLAAQLSADVELNKQIRLVLTTYYYQLDNYIERYQISDQVRSYRNLDKADIAGIEFNFDWQVNANWEMKLLGHYQKGEDDDHQPLADLVPANIAWQSRWSWHEFVFNHRMSWQFEQNEVAESEQSRASYLLWQASIEKHLTPNLLLALYGENLTDRNVYATQDEDSAKIAGRTFGIKLTWLAN